MSEAKKLSIQKYYKKKALEKFIAKKCEKKKNKIVVDVYRKKAQEDIIYKIINSLATRANKVLKKHKIKRSLTHMELIGCSKEELRSHLEKKFTKGINFVNYGKWEVDHIKPVSKFDFSNIKNVKKCFNYKNLQPLWREENQKKSNKYNSESSSSSDSD